MKIMFRALGIIATILALFPTQASATASPQYLMFQIFTYSGMVDPIVPTSTVVKDIVATIGTTGTSAQKLGFVVGPLTFDHSDAQIIDIIDQAFAAADANNVAFMLHIDDSMFWKSRTDLTSQHQNVEWTSWSGTAAGPRVLPWYSSATLAPQMCYNSPGIKAAINTRVQGVIGPQIKKDLAVLSAKGKANLFAGVIVGWETNLPNLTPALGYCALSNLGYSAASPPQDKKAALSLVVTNFIQYWEQQFIAAGVDSSKLYTHLAVPPPGANLDNAPIDVAFGPSATAGFSVYGTQTFTFPQIYQALQAKSAIHWGISEGSNLAPPNAAPGASGVPDEPMVNYLGQAYYKCATYVNLFGWQATGSAFQKVLKDPNAIYAYQLFLQGAYGVGSGCGS